MGMTQRDVVGREVGGGFMFGNAYFFHFIRRYSFAIGGWLISLLVLDAMERIILAFFTPTPRSLLDE